MVHNCPGSEWSSLPTYNDRISRSWNKHRLVTIFDLHSFVCSIWRIILANGHHHLCTWEGICSGLFDFDVMTLYNNVIHWQEPLLFIFWYRMCTFYNAAYLLFSWSIKLTCLILTTTCYYRSDARHYVQLPTIIHHPLEHKNFMLSNKNSLALLTRT